MNTPDTEWETPDEFAQKLSEKVRYFCGKGQYEENSDEQKAYIDGVETAIGMMYIDLTGTPKAKGMLSSRDTYWKERVRFAIEGKIEIEQRIVDHINTDEQGISAGFHRGRIDAFQEALDTLLDNLK